MHRLSPVSISLTVCTLLVVALAAGCKEGTSTAVTYSASPQENFDDLWKQFDQRYSFFEVKHINWDSVYSVYRPMVKETTTEPELYSIMSAMLETLKDGHVSLSTPYGNSAYRGWYQDHPRNAMDAAYLAPYLTKDFGSVCDGYIRYGTIRDTIGYINIGKSLGGTASVWAASIDVILDSLKDMRGIIVDLRENSGGNDALGNIVAGRFADKARVYSYIRWRNGTMHTDFTDFQAASVAPQGPRQYMKPVAVLTNRRCFSSAEGTILMFRALPNVTTIGDTTGGGSANPISLALPNKWTYRVSRWIQYTAEKTVFEGSGLPPDIPVWISQGDAASNRDTILERAVAYLIAK